MKKETKTFELRLKHQRQHVMCILLFICLQERKESKTPNTFDLMLEARVANFSKSPISSSMKDSNKGFKCISSLALELMVMVEFGHLIITNV
jgi:hypothetical protein